MTEVQITVQLPDQVEFIEQLEAVVDAGTERIVSHYHLAVTAEHHVFHKQPLPLHATRPTTAYLKVYHPRT